jgi:hypothetical protein
VSFAISYVKRERLISIKVLALVALLILQAPILEHDEGNLSSHCSCETQEADKDNGNVLGKVVLNVF